MVYMRDGDYYLIVNAFNEHNMAYARLGSMLLRCWLDARFVKYRSINQQLNKKRQYSSSIVVVVVRQCCKKRNSI